MSGWMDGGSSGRSGSEWMEWSGVVDGWMSE